MFLSYLDVMVNNDALDNDVCATLDEAQATIRRLRSESAALRAAGDELAAAADQVTDGVLSWPHVEGSLIRGRDAWRSVAKPRYPEGP
ncbi:hypothetical protein EV383_4435 [Pseudonocardia sediminis]|uniref:Uncharacterized protein n=1 Tax=Pseudonocardia sediminis TaxID=1397368 RepID=A0A4V2FR67_PSEST|nr:hypothetical protein EV383_4435 [Pseudonocardia sediminis]